MQGQVKIYDTAEQLFKSSSELISGKIQDTISQAGKCSFVLSGGSTPKRLYKNLGNPDAGISWDKVDLFWGDERCVPPDSDESNYKMVNENLLSKINIPQRNIFRIPAEKPHGIAAREYENILKEYFPDSEFPSFDIVLLGLGEEGHTASLFNLRNTRTKSRRWVIDVYVPTKKMWRITMTLPVLNNAKNVIFLVSGKEKSEIVKDILTDKNNSYPASRIEPVNGELIWCLDKDAASLLN